jgi:hypothetical protein
MNSASEQEIDFQRANRARLQQLLAMSVNDSIMLSQTTARHIVRNRAVHSGRFRWFQDDDR